MGEVGFEKYDVDAGEKVFEMVVLMHQNHHSVINFLLRLVCNSLIQRCISIFFSFS